MVSALTANHLAALLLPAGLAQLVIGRDNGAAGVRAAARLRDRAEAQGIVVHDLVPSPDDFNDDLRRLGPARLAGPVRDQPRSEDGRVGKAWVRPCSTRGAA